jgi:hypothetical protein
MDVVDFDFECPNDKNNSNLSSRLKNNYTFLGPHAKQNSFYYNMNHVWF